MTALALLRRLNNARSRGARDATAEHDLDRVDFARGYLRHFEKNNTGHERDIQRNPRWQIALDSFRKGRP